MKFSEINYERIDFCKSRENLSKIYKDMDKADSYLEFMNLLKKANKIRKHIMTMQTVSQIRFSMNTEDKYYKNEKEYWDEYMPLFEDLDIELYKTILESKHKEKIQEEYGNQYIKYIRTVVNGFSKEIIPLLQQENKLMSQYTELLASAKIKFDNRVCNLSDMAVYMESNNKEVREKAVRLHTNFFLENEEKFDSLFDQLVKIRHSMSKEMGFKNFIELGYLRMHRTDYNAEMVKNLRKKVLKKYVPLAEKAYKEQAERIGAKKIDYYNERIEFLDGNASLVGNGDFIIEQGKRMYSKMSPETKEYIEYLIENELFDVKPREGKAMGGYCTILYDNNDSFIFGNFNGTVDDVDVLTHEAGHGFQVYMSRNQEMPELVFPTLDSCEIFSMSMEFFTYPWMEYFFGKDCEKYKTYHYDSMIKFLPYGVLVDHFQHIIYENPNLTPKERKEEWRKLEKKYLPYRDYADLDILNRGGFWFRQGHIFKNPFYYIDYVLAEICALQFKELMDSNSKDAWNRYVKISKLGGSKSFTELVEIAGLENPFEL